MNNDNFERHSNENKYRCIDLFAGCGGVSLGFEMAGFNIPLAIQFIAGDITELAIPVTHISKNTI